jgi:hypothetical protein
MQLGAGDHGEAHVPPGPDASELAKLPLGLLSRSKLLQELLAVNGHHEVDLACLPVAFPHEYFTLWLQFVTGSHTGDAQREHTDAVLVDTLKVRH